MNTPTKKYTLPELKVGMRVKLSELQGILDTHMILTNTEIINSDDLIGTLVFFGTDKKEYMKWFKQSEPITHVYYTHLTLPKKRIV